jgi:hypothetical protein
METSHTVRSVIVLGLIIIGMFVFAYIKRTEIQNEKLDDLVETTTPDTAVDAYSNITRIDAKHFFIDGEHTIVGEIAMPTPCDLLNWSNTIAESYPEQVTVAFDVINNAEMCAQTVTSQRFKVTFSASEGALIGATFEGRNVELNLVPALPGESPDDYELFIKG